MSKVGDVIENPITGELAVQKVFFETLAPIARALGYRGSYPEYLNRTPSERVEREPWPGWVRGNSPRTTRAQRRAP